MALQRTAPGWKSVTAVGGSAGAPDARARRPARGAGRIPPGGAVGVGIVVALAAAAVIGPALVGADPGRQDLGARLAPPLGFGGSGAHPLGTDHLGRDLLARVVAGARVSLLLGAAATLVAGLVGTALGLVAGFVGGAVDRVVAWTVDVQLAVPFVVVAIALAAVLDPGVWPTVLTLSLTGWVGYARVTRLRARSLRRAPWVEAARSVGVGPGRLLGRHVLPNLAGPVVLLAGQQAAAVILYEAALSYLGLGVGAETVTWGAMVQDGQETLATAWWVATVPGAAVALTVLGLNLVGDWLVTRDRAT